MNLLRRIFFQWHFLAIVLLFIPSIALAQFSVDEDPREIPLDPGDMFLAGLTCNVDDGDFSGGPGIPMLNVPNPLVFDLDAYSFEEPLQVCPAQPQYPPGILFSFDDGDPGPGVGTPDNDTEIFFYDHCYVMNPTTRHSYYTTITESALGLGADPPPTGYDDDVDAYETRAITNDQWWAVLFSPDTPSDGGFGPGSEGDIFYMNASILMPVIWATPASLGVPNQESCNIDGIATIYEAQRPFVILFTTDASKACGLDPGDIYVSDNAGHYWLYADDVVDMKIAFDEFDNVDIDALAINYYGQFQIDGIYKPRDPNFYKADWPNYAPSGMPDFEQSKIGWPSTFCGPTAVSDSLWWFDSELECDSDYLSGVSNEIEPNDTPTSANKLGEAPPLVGILSSISDIDWYRFEMPGKSYRTCRIRVSTCALRQPGDADTRLSLYDGSTGTPGNLIATNDNGCLPDLQSEIDATGKAGTRYYVKVEGGASGADGHYTLSLGIDCYPLVEVYSGEPDDHSSHNVRPLIVDLSKCMNTDDIQGTGSGHLGTRITDMKTCIDTWLANKNLKKFYTNSIGYAPLFSEVEEEIKKSEDVVLLLGFYWFDGSNWIRCGGHYVTSAGVDSMNQTVTVSDPQLNNAEAGGGGRVRGPDHANHDPTLNPPSSHDDAQNLSHDRYSTGLPNVPVSISNWSIPTYATVGTPTTCYDVAQWCMYDWGQNWPGNTSPLQIPCPDPAMPVSVEVEAMVDVSPVQTPICLYLDIVGSWPNNLKIKKNPCTLSSPTPDKYDVIRGKLCNLKFSMLAPQVDLDYVQCLYDNAAYDRYDELSPDDTKCTGGWFYLLRKSIETNYGTAYPGGEVRIPGSGGCP